MIEQREPSPFVELVGGRMEECREGYVRMSLEVRPHHTNPHGVMHGGVITTLMDDVMGRVIASVRGLEAMRDSPHATVDMNVSFLSAARPGDALVVEGRVLRLGKTVAFGEAEARRRGDDDPIARGRFTFVIAPGRSE